MLTLRLTGVRDYSVFEDGQRIGRIRFASERSPGVWLWHVQVHIPSRRSAAHRASMTPSGTSGRTGWRSKPSNGSQALAAAYRAMNLRDEP